MKSGWFMVIVIHTAARGGLEPLAYTEDRKKHLDFREGSAQHESCFRNHDPQNREIRCTIKECRCFGFPCST